LLCGKNKGSISCFFPFGAKGSVAERSPEGESGMAGNSKYHWFMTKQAINQYF
jgi:hypothetical protein